MFSYSMVQNSASLGVSQRMTPATVTVEETAFSVNSRRLGCEVMKSIQLWLWLGLMKRVALAVPGADSQAPTMLR